MTMRVRVVRGGALAGVSGLAGAWLAQQAGLAAASGPTLETVLVAAVALGGAAAGLGVAVTTAIAVGEQVLLRRPSRAALALPAPLRRFLVGSVGAALVAGMAVPAQADEAYPGWAAPVPNVVATPVPSVVATPVPSVVATPVPSVVATPVPSAVAAPPKASETPAPGFTVEAAPPAQVVELHAESAAGPRAVDQASSPAGDTHVVVRGESLWRIAAGVLGPDARDAAIASAWPAIYQANRDVIGADPGLILPGQRLVIPTEVRA